MEERRKFPRNALPQKAKFFGAKGWEDCLITEVSRKGLGVTFYTNEPVKILEWERGTIISFLKASEEKPVFQVDPNNYSRYEPLLMNLPLKAQKTSPLVLKGEKGGSVILKSEKLSI